MTDNEHEFRDFTDDAWYNVQLVFDGKNLIVKFTGFPESDDRVFEPSKFESLEKLEDFKERFRPVSLQLQDNDCEKAVKGMVVCASCSVIPDDNRFWDATIDEVINKEHLLANQEVCLCTFILSWEHGLHAGTLSASKLENICFIQERTHMLPELSSFVTLVEENIKATSVSEIVDQAEDFKCYEMVNTSASPSKRQLTLAKRRQEGYKHALRTTGKISTYEGINGHLHITNEVDKDMGGADKCNAVLLNNIDKELSPAMIKEFIHKQTSIEIQAYVSPSSLSDTYTNGAIMSRSKEDFEKVCEFLESPNQIIKSASGRVWVVTRKLSWHITDKPSHEALSLRSLNSRSIISGDRASELKVVYSGTEEYTIGKQLQDMFTEFATHQLRLHKGLAEEEGKLLQQSTYRTPNPSYITCINPV